MPQFAGSKVFPPPPPRKPDRGEGGDWIYTPLSDPPLTRHAQTLQKRRRSGLGAQGWVMEESGVL